MESNVGYQELDMVAQLGNDPSAVEQQKKLANVGALANIGALANV